MCHCYNHVQQVLECSGNDWHVTTQRTQYDFFLSPVGIDTLSCWCGCFYGMAGHIGLALSAVALCEAAKLHDVACV